MLSSLPPATNRFLRELSRINERMMTAQDQLGSGLRIKNASDEPDQISSLLQLRSELERNSQVRANLNRVKTEVDDGESSLQDAVSVVEQIRTLGAQGNTGTQTAETRQILADQISTLLEELVGLSNTQVDGRYIFAGDADNVMPYTLDWQQAAPVSTYGGTAATRQIALPNGSKTSISRTAQEIFDSPTPGENVFGSVIALRDALLADDQDAIGTALGQVTSANTYLNRQLGFYGKVQNQVVDALDDASSRDLQLRTQIAAIEEADATSAILELQQATFQQDAALSAHAQIPRRSLFDYFK